VEDLAMQAKLDKAPQLGHSVAQFLFGCIGLASLTFVCFWLGFNVPAAGVAYLILIVALLHLMGSFAVSIILSFIAVLCLCYFFAPPLFSLRVHQVADILVIAAFLITSIVATSLTAKVRKVAEQTQAAQKALVDTIPAMVWTALPDGSRDFHSQRWLDFTGLSAEEGRGQGWTAAIHAQDRAAIMEKWRSAVTTGGTFEAEARARGANGEYRWFLARAEPLRDESGSIVRWYGTSTDIEDRKRATEALRQSEQQWKEIFEHNPVMYFMVDPAGTVLSVNSFGAAQLGYAVDELIGQSVLNVFFEEDREAVQKSVAACLKDVGRSHSWEIRKVRKDGTVLWVRENAKAVRRADSQLIVLVACEDVTERKRTEDDLRLREAYMAHAQQLAGVGSWAYRNSYVGGYWDTPEHWSPEMWRIADFNPSEGYPATELIFSRIHPEDRKRMIEANAHVVSDGRVLDIQYRYSRADGQLRTLHSIGTLVLENGVPSRFVGSTLDITEREQRVEELRRNELYLAEGQRLANMGSWRFDPSGTFDFWSEDLFRIYGLNREQGAPTLEQYLATVHTEDREFMSQLIEKMVAQSLGCDVTKRIVRPSGEVRYIRCVGVPNLENGVLLNIFGTAIDVTEQEHLTQELQRREAYLAEAQRLSHTGSFGWSVATGEITWSEETFRIFECDRAVQPTLKLILQRTHPEDRVTVERFLEHVSGEGKDWDFEHRLLTPNDAVKYVQVVARATKDASGRLEFVGAVMDVTATRRADEELHQIRAQLTHVARVTTLGELTASIAHEVNQPLAGVVSSGNACLRWLDNQPPDIEKARNSVNRLIRDANRASQVVVRVRDLAKNAPTQKGPLNINETVEEIVALTRREVMENQISLTTELSKDIPLILADRIQLQQVILNLTINAIEALSALSDGPRKLFVITERDQTGGVCLTVADSGPGLDPDRLEDIFDAFYTTKREGMGMGLAVSRSIIEAHQGRLWATPNKPSGAKFQFMLPQDEAS
jgi:PAS domain S-box-containing protein